jgi:hypothetical protein
LVVYKQVIYPQVVWDRLDRHLLGFFTCRNWVFRGNFIDF